MANKVPKIAFDCGHGLETPGKQTPDGIKEWTLNDKVRDEAVKILKDYDCEIIFTDGNEGKVDESLSSRLNQYLKEGVDAFVSAHHNAFEGKWCYATGVEVYTDNNPTKEDIELANCIYKRLVEYTGLKGRGIKKADFYVINQDRIPAVLVEGGFMDSKTDYKVITSEKGQKAYGKAVAEGLIEFLDLKKKPKKTTTKKKTVTEWAKEVIAGKHGNGHLKRKSSLKKAGCTYSYSDVKKRVNELSKQNKTKKKTLEDWAKEVIAGKHGNGHANREKSLKKAGCQYDYAKVRAKVNELC